MIISFTGPQSSGKSTLLSQFVDEFPDFYQIPEVTRKVKRDYNVIINEGGTNVTQYLIGAEHLQNSFRYNRDDDVIMDRCIIDGVVYTIVLRDMLQVPQSVVDYFLDLSTILLPRIDVVFYTEPLDTIEEDGERTTDKRFHDKVVSEFNVYINTVEVRYPNIKIVRLPNASIEERMSIIRKTCKL